MNKIRYFILRILMPQTFKEVLIDVMFSKWNDDVEALGRYLYKLGLIKKDKDSWYIKERNNR